MVKTLKELFEGYLKDEIDSYFGDRQTAKEIAKEQVTRWRDKIIFSYLGIDTWGDLRKDGILCKKMEESFDFDFDELIKAIVISPTEKKKLMSIYRKEYIEHIEYLVKRKAEDRAEEEFQKMTDFDNIKLDKSIE